jgi:hypothetical protein
MLKETLHGKRIERIGGSRLNGIGRTLLCCFLAALTSGYTVLAEASEPGAPPALDGPQVVAQLMRHNAERAALLKRYVACRYYSIRYSGFPSDKSADMLVSVAFEAPAKRDFHILRANGSHLLSSHVLKELLAHEKESQDPQNAAQTALSTDNYDFQLVGTDTLNGRPQYVLQVTPRTQNKYLYRGKLWVDASEFAVSKLSAEPATNPSFWITHTDIQHEYKKVDKFWLPAQNTTVSKIRMGGSAKLRIQYLDYEIGAAASAADAACANVPSGTAVSENQ